MTRIVKIVKKMSCLQCVKKSLVVLYERKHCFCNERDRVKKSHVVDQVLYEYSLKATISLSLHEVAFYLVNLQHDQIDQKRVYWHQGKGKLDFRLFVLLLHLFEVVDWLKLPLLSMLYAMMWNQVMLEGFYIAVCKQQSYDWILLMPWAWSLIFWLNKQPQACIWEARN